jgi:hypothetical protein
VSGVIVRGVEQFGERFFLTLDREALQAWRVRPQVQNRISALCAGADRWLQQRRRRGENIPDRTMRDQLCPGYLLAHSLAHALITELAIDCGYPASSIHERIYIALPAMAHARGASFGHETIPSQANKARGIFSVTTMMGLSSNIIR